MLLIEGEKTQTCDCYQSTAPFTQRRHQSQVFLLDNYFKFDNTDNIKQVHGLAQDWWNDPVHSTKQNKPDINHGTETILKNGNVMLEIEFNNVLNKSSTITQWGQLSISGKLYIVTTSC